MSVPALRRSSRSLYATCLQRVLKCLCDVAKHLGGNSRGFEDAHLQERLVALSRDKDVVLKSLATQAIKEFADAGVAFPSG